MDPRVPLPNSVALPDTRIHGTSGLHASANAPEHAQRLFGDWRDLRASLMIGFCCLIIYNANGRSISAVDTYPTRYLPFAIWKYHTLALDPLAQVAAQGRGETAFWLKKTATGRTISLYPVVQPVLIAPFYLSAVQYLDERDWQDWRIDHVARVMEKLVASIVAALSVAVLYLVLRRRAEPRIARLLTLAYAFGTTTWTISSQALWQHGMAQLLIACTLLILTAPCTAARAIAAGVLCGLIADNRPPDAILAVALGTYGLFWAGRRWPLLVVAALLPIGLVLLYNLQIVGHVAGGYGLAKGHFFHQSLLDGLAGLLVSPTRGLLVFSPFLAFLALAWTYLPRERATVALTAAMSAGIAGQLVLYALYDWRGGMSFGPRYLTDVGPLLVWMLVPVVTALSGAGRALFITTVAVAVAIQAIGAFYYTGRSDIPIFAVANGPHRMRAAWAWRNAPFISSLRDGVASPDLMIMTSGSFDAVQLNGRSTSIVIEGDEVLFAGWALADNGTPYQVSVEVAGRPPAATQTFADRPDVRAAFQTDQPAGWNIRFSTKGLTPGEYVLNAFVWSLENGDQRYLAQRTLTVQAAVATSADLDGAFRIAAARVRAHQQPPGFWLTTHTTSTSFTNPQPEMNTYLTALLIDMLEPLTAAGNFADVGARAREHLTKQIEATGLVRYHGLPDAPGIGTLGCAITPDADDTSLAWRIAPPLDRGRLASALTTLAGYRRDDGLYRTWLAPRDKFQCLDPGKDPNPADATIQMHVLQMLVKEQPAAGRALCTALRTAIGHENVWVYYAKSPLVPLLRIPDLSRAGCPLQLPEWRNKTTVPSQEIWLTIVKMLTEPAFSKGSADTEGARTLLAQLADQDFALLRAHPPLLYHNDLTATVPRYYWSEDVGYALWLRLAYEHARIGR